MKVGKISSDIEWTKLISSLLLIFAGGYIPLLANPDGVSLSLSALMAAFGGALLADSIKNKEQAAKEIHPRINSINRLLATVTSKIGAITADGLATAPSNLPAQKIGDWISILRTVVADLSDITGQKFDPSVLNETIDSIGRLITELELGEAATDEHSVISSLKDIFEDLQSKQISKTNETVNCPHSDCGAEVVVSLGVPQASTSTVKCQECDKRFNVHRIANDKVITREIKTPTKSKPTNETA